MTRYSRWFPIAALALVISLGAAGCAKKKPAAAPRRRRRRRPQPRHRRRRHPLTATAAAAGASAAHRGGGLRGQVGGPAECREAARRRVLRLRLSDVLRRGPRRAAEERRLAQTLDVGGVHGRRPLRQPRNAGVQPGARRAPCDGRARLPREPRRRRELACRPSARAKSSRSAGKTTRAAGRRTGAATSSSRRSSRGAKGQGQGLGAKGPLALQRSLALSAQPSALSP